MIGFLVRKIFGSKNDRFLKKLRPLVAKINALEPEMQALADEELPQRLAVYREQVQNGEKDLDAVLPEVFALVREASTRVLGMRHYDVQLLGAMALHNGKIAEMKTGEGKTLVATLAVILNSLEGKGVHVVTVNDYLAKRDAEWMGRLYNFLGLSVGVIVAGLSDEQRKEAYGADITYGTNNEFGFDYLRDNMAIYKQAMVQRGHAFAIVDEVDSILIDEARTPLIISGAGTKSASTYKDFARAVRGLERGEDVSHDMLTATEDVEPTGDYVMDEAKHTIAATERGLKKIERRLGIDDIYADLSGQLVNHLQQALKFALKKRGKEIPVATILTQMVVDAQDPGFKNPTKPIGPFYSEEEAKALVAEKGYTVKEDAGRGWRRVVASPIPTEIVELDSVKRLFDSTIVITCGGGGIPVVRKEDGDL